jgi:hypothetical protein
LLMRIGDLTLHYIFQWKMRLRASLPGTSPADSGWG